MVSDYSRENEISKTSSNPAWRNAINTFSALFHSLLLIPNNTPKLVECHSEKRWSPPSKFTILANVMKVTDLDDLLTHGIIWFEKTQSYFHFFFLWTMKSGHRNLHYLLLGFIQLQSRITNISKFFALCVNKNWFNYAIKTLGNR